MNDIIKQIAKYDLCVEVYPNIVYVARRGIPYVEEYVKVKNVGNNKEIAIELAVEKAIRSIEGFGKANAA